MAFKYKLKEEPFNVGDTETKGGIKTTITDLDPETGAVTWDVKNVPAIDSTFKEFKELRRFITQLARDTEDTVIDDLADQINNIFNKYRTHIRKKYPKSYKRVNEENIDEEIDIKAPIASSNLTKANNQINNTSGLADYILDVINQIKDKEQEGLFNDSNIKQAINFLEKAKGVDEASMSGGAGAYLTPYAFRLKNQKPNIKAYKELGYKEVKEGVGATLGPGPKASEDGVRNNAYVKQFKYKLVPKTKDGTYVQKGSGLEVSKLF